MNNKLLIGIVIGVLIIAGIWLFQRDDETVQDNVDNSTETTEQGSDDASTQTDENMTDDSDNTDESGDTSADVDTASQGEVVIVYTEDGYEPSEVTITSGTTVTFQNQTDGLMWPASAVHPTHQVLPEFDAKGGVKAGGEYSFTFTDEGSWAFHDHLSPRYTGEITVE